MLAVYHLLIHLQHLFERLKHWASYVLGNYHMIIYQEHLLAC